MNLDEKAPDFNVVWEPIPNSSQEIAITSPCDHTLYAGSRGPGKTDTQLMYFRQFVGVGYGSFWRGVIFDREYKNLGDIIEKSKRWFPAFDDGAKFLQSTSDLKWVWPSGEVLEFRVAKRDGDYWNYHGQEYPFIGWNELAKYPTSKLYDDMISCNRSSYTPEKNGWIGGTITQPGKPPVGPNGEVPPPIPLRVFSTTNPYGPGHSWVKRRFIDPAPYGTIVGKSDEVFNPRTKKKETITITQVALFGSYKENIYLDPKYIAQLNSIRDKNKRKAWLQGNWDITAGGAFDDLWDSETHIVPRFKIPKGWIVDRSFDDGSARPFSVGWWAECNGEEATLPDGTKWAPPAGTLIQIAQAYGSENLGNNEGVGWTPKRIAEEILTAEAYLKEFGWIPSDVLPGPADNAIAAVTRTDVQTVKEVMESVGVFWEESDKSPGSRIVGVKLFRQRLENSLLGEGEGIYFMRNCEASIQLIPTLPRDDLKIDDVDTDAEDHAWDMTRYRVLKGANRLARNVKLDWY